MSNKEKLCLQLRNKTTRSEETYCKHYTKKFRGYVRRLFLNYKSIGLIVMMIFIASLLLAVRYVWKDEDSFGLYIGYGLFAIALFFWIYEIIKGLWFWKYAKHVVVTNEGVWIMVYSTFWWNEDFTGKKRFLSPAWSRYDWGEIKITDDDKARPKTTDKIGKFFNDFDYAVIKSSKLKSLFMTRFDGIEEIDFLEEADANEILAYAKEQRKRKKRKKKDTEIIEEEYDKLPDDEYVTDDGE